MTCTGWFASESSLLSSAWHPLSAAVRPATNDSDLISFTTLHKTVSADEIYMVKAQMCHRIEPGSLDPGDCVYVCAVCVCGGGCWGCVLACVRACVRMCVCVCVFNSDSSPWTSSYPPSGHHTAVTITVWTDSAQSTALVPHGQRSAKPWRILPGTRS